MVKTFPARAVRIPPPQIAAVWIFPIKDVNSPFKKASFPKKPNSPLINLPIKFQSYINLNKKNVFQKMSKIFWIDKEIYIS